MPLNTTSKTQRAVAKAESITTWTELGSAPALANALTKLGFTTPREIQRSLATCLEEGLNVIITAPYSAGRTTGVLVSAINCVLARKSSQQRDTAKYTGVPRPTVLIISPTRTLGNEVYIRFDAILKAMTTPTCTVAPKLAYTNGGTFSRAWMQKDESHCDILVVTVGCLRRLIKERAVSLNALAMVVYVQADVVLNNDNQPSVHALVQQIRSISELRTLANNREKILSVFICPPTHNDAHVTALRSRIKAVVGEDNIVRVDCRGRPLKHIRAEIVARLRSSRGHLRAEALMSILVQQAQRSCGQTLVIDFKIQHLAHAGKVLSNSGLLSRRITSLTPPAEIVANVKDFKDGRFKILFATAALIDGMNFPGVDNIVVYGLPRAIAWKSNPRQPNHTLRSAQSHLESVIACVGRRSMDKPVTVTVFMGLDKLRDREYAPFVARIMSQTDSAVPPFLKQYLHKA